MSSTIKKNNKITKFIGKGILAKALSIDSIVGVSSKNIQGALEEISSGSSIPTSLIEEIVAIENLIAFNVVNGDGTNANSSIVNKRDKAIGIIPLNINNGFSGEIVVGGIIENPLWSWSDGDILYLNGATLSTISPVLGFSQKIAVAISSTKVIIQIESSILL